MSEETYIRCDMEDCKDGKYMYKCTECCCDVCSLCEFTIKDRIICPNCIKKMLTRDDLEFILKKKKLIK